MPDDGVIEEEFLGGAMIYVSKPSSIEAVQWTGDWPPVEDFAGDKVRPFHPPDGKGHIEDRLMLLAGAGGAQDWVPVPVGHWLVCQPGDKSDIWPVDPDDFDAKYEPLAEATCELCGGAYHGDLRCEANV